MGHLNSFLLFFFFFLGRVMGLSLIHYPIRISLAKWCILQIKLERINKQIKACTTVEKELYWVGTKALESVLHGYTPIATAAKSKPLFESDLHKHAWCMRASTLAIHGFILLASCQLFPIKLIHWLKKAFLFWLFYGRF